MDANRGGQLVPTGDVVNDLAINQAKLRSLNAENFRGGGGFALADFGRTEGRRLATGHVDQMDPMPLLDKPGDRTPHAKLLVVWMRADDEKRRHRFKSQISNFKF